MLAVYQVGIGLERMNGMPKPEVQGGTRQEFHTWCDTTEFSGFDMNLAHQRQFRLLHAQFQAVLH